jgi:hypothetical protein
MKRASEVLTVGGTQAFHAHLYNMEQAVSFLLSHANELELSQEIVDILYATVNAHEELGEGQALDFYST